MSHERRRPGAKVVSQSPLAQAIVRAGMTQGEVARAVGVARQSVARYISGEFVPSLTIARKIAAVVGEPVEKLWPNE